MAGFGLVNLPWPVLNSVEVVVLLFAVPDGQQQKRRLLSPQEDTC